MQQLNIDQVEEVPKRRGTFNNYTYWVKLKGQQELLEIREAKFNFHTQTQLAALYSRSKEGIRRKLKY